MLLPFTHISRCGTLIAAKPLAVTTIYVSLNQIFLSHVGTAEFPAVKAAQVELRVKTSYGYHSLSTEIEYSVELNWMFCCGKKTEVVVLWCCVPLYA